MKWKPYATVVASLIALTGCASGPDYRAPTSETSANWQTPQTTAQESLESWWSRFADPILSDLLLSTLSNSPSFDNALARIDKARAELRASGAGGLPTLNAFASSKKAGLLNQNSATTRTNAAGFDASWELDLFGKARRARESASALLSAREADRQGVQISLMAELARDYVDYRVCRARQSILEQQAASQKQTRELIHLQHLSGMASQADAHLADAALAEANAVALSQAADCEQLVKALASLSQMPEPTLRKRIGNENQPLPTPTGFRISEVAGDLLRQRPDVVSAERELAAASAQIGVAEAARWPSFTLTGNISISAINGGASTTPWSFGPAITLPVFDGGRIEASIGSAKADYAIALASYRQTVQDAVCEVEQALVRLNSMAQREGETATSVAAYHAYQAALEARWKAGAASLLDLETARRATLTADLALITIQQNRLADWIALYKALGGGWEAPRGNAP